VTISPLAYVAPWVRFGEGCVVHPFAVVGQLPSPSRALARAPIQAETLVIGPRTVICAHAVIYSGCAIGADCLIGDAASIREGSVIGDRCVIGRHVTVLYDAEIDDDVRLFDGTHITGGCRIGTGCFFGPGVLTSNNRRVDLEDYHHPPSNPPTFGRRVMVGTGANILAGVNVGDGALIGIGAVVVEDVPPDARVLGHKAAARVSRYAVVPS
jgi:acetyltransferase-like isoleucine patch superfamily enzyme